MRTESRGHLKKHEGRDDLIGEHRWGDTGQLILLVLFLIVWIPDSFFLHWSTFLIDEIPLWIRLLSGTAVLAIAWKIARAGLKIVFGEKRDQPEVITKGIFSRVRHPVYLGAILLYAGMILYSLSLFAVIIWLFIVIFYVFIARYEEKMLLFYFKGEYEAYKREVPMLFPGLRPGQRK